MRLETACGTRDTSDPKRKGRRTAPAETGYGGGTLKKHRVFWLLALLIAALALVVAGCGGDDDDDGEATPTATEEGGAEGKTVKIVSDLPLQGSDRVQTEQMV